MIAMEELDIGMVQVGHSYTGFIEDTNAGINLLSRGTSHPVKQVSLDKSTESISERFTLDAHKIYLGSCATYHSSSVRWMLGNVHQVSIVLQGDCNTG